MKDSFLMFTFASTHDALRFESVMEEENLEVKLVPVPRQISASCGIAAKVALEQKEKILEICEQKELQFSAGYKITDNDSVRKIEKLQVN